MMHTTVKWLLSISLMGVANLYAGAEVRIGSAFDGGMEVVAPAYRVLLDKNGSPRSLQVAGVEMFGSHPDLGTGSFLVLEAPPGQTGIVSGRLKGLKLEHVDIGKSGEVGKLKDQSPWVRVHGKAGDILYTFRDTDFDISLRSTEPRGFQLMLVPSANVVGSVDLVTDQVLSMSAGNAVGHQQEGMRWATKQGPMLRFEERIDGYTSFYWWSDRHGGKQRAVTLSARERPVVFTVRALARPGIADALQLSVAAKNPEFLMPGSGQVSFDVVAHNLAADLQVGSVDFEVRDYRTEKVLASCSTPIEVKGQQTQPVKAEVPFNTPGPFRGVLVLKKGSKSLRELKCVFTYDFKNYQPGTTRPDDFKSFWKETLAELAAVPIDAKLKLNEEHSTDKIAVYEVSLATLGGQRFWAWYCRPRAEGKYPVYVFCPPSGVYPMPIRAGTGAGRYATLSMAIHPWNLHLSDMPAQHPWRGYHTAGIASPKTASWRTIYCSLVRSIDFLVSRPEVDPGRIAVGGSSQGGGLAMVLAGLDPRVAVCLPQYSGLPRLDWTVKHNTGYWPFGMAALPKGQTEDEFLRTLAYFDAANFTPDIHCPTVALIGMQDWVTASGNQIAALAQLPSGQVEIICDPWGGHGSGDLALRQRFQAALGRFLDGKKVIETPSK